MFVVEVVDVDGCAVIDEVRDEDGLCMSIIR